MSGYSARPVQPGFCENCHKEIDQFNWMAQHARQGCTDPLCDVCRIVECHACKERRALDASISWLKREPLSRPGAVAGEAVKTRYSVGEAVTLALCAVLLATVVFGVGYVFVDDVLKIIGGR